MSRFSFILGLVFTMAFSAADFVSAASPSLGGIEPRGIQRGVESVLSFNGGRLADAVEILFYDPAGFEVKKLEPVAGNVKVTVNVKPTCRLGEHVAQVRTKSGVSEFKTFWVGPFGPTAEKEPNSDFAAPQAIPLNTTVVGSIGNEDVDYYVVEAKKGQRISAEIEAIRLGTALFDAYVAILNSKRFELSSADDSPLIFQDALASAIAPEDGKYIIEVRESAYGNGNRYRLHVGTFPRPTAVYPAGGQQGQDVEVKFLGDPSGPIIQKVKLPVAPDPKFALHAANSDGVAPTGNPFRLFEHGNVLEVEPNDTVKEATPGQLPLAFNGIIEKLGDVDYFKFTAKKGQVFDYECYARRIRSGLDPIMTLHRADGGAIASNDDSRGPDSYLRATIPADGEYLISVRDHLGKGAPDYVYRVELTPPKPFLTIGIPRVARYSQYRQWIVVPRGNRFASLMTFSRANFGGPIVLDPKDMPAGITIHGQFPTTGGSLPVVFEAAADAPVTGKLVDFTGRHADPKINVASGYYNAADFIRGAPGQSIYWQVKTNRIPVCVVDEVPFKLEIVEPKAPIVRDGSMSLKILVHRKEGYNKPINVQMPYRPPGIGATSSITIPGDKSEAVYPISANGSAGINKWKFYVIGSADAGGAAWVSSQLATLEIAERFVTVELQRAATEQGQDTEIVAKITHNRAFEGAAKVQLLGLPPKTETTEMQLTKGQEELVFPIKVDKAAKAGTQKNIFIRLVLTEQGEQVMHSRLGSTELRIDLPPPPKKNEPPKPKPVAAAVKKPTPTPAAPTPKKVVRLTRLQKLRLKAKQQQQAGDSAGGGKK